MPTLNPRADSALRVVVGVLTFHRPEQIAETVQLLVAQLDTLADGDTGEVLVVDNDPAGSGRDAVAALGLDRVRVVVEPTPGIAAARNRAIDEAQGSDLLLFLDDDGRPGEGWLRRMVDAWRASGAAAVAGWVDTHYLGEVDAWIMAGGFFTRRRHEDGTVLPAAACGNLLLDLHQLGSRRFSLAMGLSGGEDTLLTRSLVADGGRIVFCRDAVVIDQVATDRINRPWVLLRSLSHGNTGGILSLHLSTSPLARPKLVAGALARVGAGAGRAVVGLARRNPTDQARGARAAMRGAGMLAAAAGWNYEEYARDASFRQRFTRIPDTLAPGGFAARTTSDPRGAAARTTSDPRGGAAHTMKEQW